MTRQRLARFNLGLSVIGVLVFMAGLSGWIPASLAYADVSGRESQSRGVTSTMLGGIDLGNLPNYLFVFTGEDASGDWHGPSDGIVGDIAINGDKSWKPDKKIPYAGTIYTNEGKVKALQDLVEENLDQAFYRTGETARLNGLQTDLNNAFTQINRLTATPGYTGVAATALNGLNTVNNNCGTYVINIVSGMSISSKIYITGDACDIFFLRWDKDADFTNGYDGQVEFKHGGAIVPLGGLKATNFVHVAGEIDSSGEGSVPLAPFPQGPRLEDGQGALCIGCKNFGKGNFFTGYWLTTGKPKRRADEAHSMPYGDNPPTHKGTTFVGGWYTIADKFHLDGGTSGVYVSPPPPRNGAPTPTPPPPTPTPLPISGEQCYIGTFNTAIGAYVSWRSNGNSTTSVFTEFTKNLVDNTYGAGAIGWGTKGHKFDDLVRTDSLQLALYDTTGALKMEFQVDYIDRSNLVPSGYKTLGVSGGDGRMLTGNANDVAGVRTSLSENLNTFGYSMMILDSPATDANYTPNAQYPNWIYDVWYEVAFRDSAFPAGFYYPLIRQVSVDPSKTGRNIEYLTPGSCDNPAFRQMRSGVPWNALGR